MGAQETNPLQGNTSTPVTTW